MAKHKRDKDKKKHKKEKKENREKHKKRKHESNTSESESDGGNEMHKRLRAEQLAGKVAKHLKKHHTVSTYTNDDNPFGDATLGERFVWHKKLEKQILEGTSVKDLTAKAERKRQAEREEEIEKVKKRREEREAERQAVEEELAELNRQRALAEAAELEAKEEQFHLEQARARAEQRLREGRAKPIDLVAKNLHLADDFDGDAQEPYKVFRGLSLAQLRELQDDIKAYQELDCKDEEHVEFWRCMAIVCESELREVERIEDEDKARMRRNRSRAGGGAGARDRGMHASVNADVQMMLAGKTYAQLDELEEGITQQLDSGEAADPEYWAAVLRAMVPHKAKAKLRNIHRSLLQRHLDHMRGSVDVAEAMGWEQEEQQQQQEEEEQRQHVVAGEDQEEDEGRAEGGTATAARCEGTGLEPEAAEVFAAKWEQEQQGQQQHGGDLEPPGEEGEEEEGQEEEEEEEEENTGQYSPRAMPMEQVQGQDVVTEKEDMKLLQLLREQVAHQEAAEFRAGMAARRARGKTPADLAYEASVRSAGTRGVHPMLKYVADASNQELTVRSGTHAVDVDAAGAGPEDEATRQFRAASSRLMSGDAATDAPFTGELELDSQVYWWHEKYRPRKPKYFNRIHTGYEWNKYNQTHYDSDNPPPKVVQGYKFNVFYPELIDRNKTPSYSVEKDPESEDGSTCMLRFSAGPPYEDIAFRIVNKEWEYSHKRGFKCTFERGIMHLYFNFQRPRYRR